MTKNQNPKGPALWEWKVALFRRKFAAREDRFYKKRFVNVSEEDPDTGEKKWVEKGTFMLACDNYGSQEHCLITKKAGNCSTCTKHQYTAYTDEVAGRHIFGEEQLCLMTIREEGIKFGAIDFDYSEREGVNAIFEDAKRVHDYCIKTGIQCYIARSSNKGYHLYFFFKDFIPPHIFNSFARHLLAEQDYYARHNLNAKVKIPEIFPKQTSWDHSRNANGIRVPMSEPDMRKGKNCFVDNEGNPIPFEDQWKYFENTHDITKDEFDSFMETNKVEIFFAPATQDAARARAHDERKKELEKNGGVPEIKHRSGSFWNIVAGCPAMMEYWARDKDGSYLWDKSNPKGLFNSARVASMNLALATVDGEDALLKRWPTDKTKSQIDSAKEKGYKPCTCVWMQQNNVCMRGKHPKSEDKTYCLEKLPPTETVDGKVVVNPNGLEKELWYDPSPYRHANSNHMSLEDIIERMRVLFAAQKDGDKKSTMGEDGRPIVEGNFRPDNLEDMREAIFKKIGFLKPLELKKVRDKVTSNKWMSAKMFDEYLKVVKKATAAEFIENSKKSEKNYRDQDNDIFLEEGHMLVKKWTDAKGNSQRTPISEFWVELIEERIFIRLNEKGDDGLTVEEHEDREMLVTVHGKDEKHTFPIKSDQWMNDNKFFAAIHRSAGSKFSGTRRQDYETVKLGALKLSEKVQVKKVVYDIGYYRMPFSAEGSEKKYVEKWIMPSVIVSKEGIFPNEEYQVKLEGDVCKPLDFKLLKDDEEMKELGAHIATDFFNCNNPMITQTVFAHAMASTIVERLGQITGYRKAPILWIAGDHGQGKSFVAELAMNFFGNFSKNNIKINSDGSPKSWTGVADKYRHAFMLIDDVKDSIKKDKTQVISFVQGAYDRNVRTALQRDGRTREKSDKVRGLICITGEDYPEQEASAISRLILLDAEQIIREDSGIRATQNRTKYCGFTPHVIHFWMKMSDKEILELWNQYLNAFYAGASEEDKRSNARRICENLTLNMIGFRLGIETMYEKGSISDVKKDELLRQHQKNLMLLKTQVMSKVSENRGSSVFLRYIKQLIATNLCFIENWPGNDQLNLRNAKSVGFYNPKDPDVVFLFPDTSVAEVAKFAGQTGSIIQNATHIKRQLLNDGQLHSDYVTKESTRPEVLRKVPHSNGGAVWVMPLKISALGLDDLSKVAAQASMAPSGVVRKMASSDDGFPIS